MEVEGKISDTEDKSNANNQQSLTFSWCKQARCWLVAVGLIISETEPHSLVSCVCVMICIQVWSWGAVLYSHQKVRGTCQVQVTSVFLPEQKRTSAAVSKLMDEFLWVVLGLILNRGDHTPPTPICRLITDILHKNYKLIAYNTIMHQIFRSQTYWLDWNIFSLMAALTPVGTNPSVSIIKFTLLFDLTWTASLIKK